MNYYKLPPEWAKRLPGFETSPEHPDGWYLLIPTKARKLLEMLSVEEYGVLESIDDAVRAIGGCVYTEQEAIQSMKGNPAYMMNVEKEEPETAIAEATSEEEQVSETSGIPATQLTPEIEKPKSDGK